MESKNQSQMARYQRKHLHRETPPEKGPGRMMPQPHSNPEKGRRGQLKHMKETLPSNGKGAPNPFYCCPTDNKGWTPTVIGVVLACSNCSASEKPKMVRR